MSRRLKLSILGGVVLIVLFCGSGLAGRVPQGSLHLRLDLRAPSAAWLRSRLTEKLHGEDLQLQTGVEAGCVVQGDQLIIPAGARCEFAVPASSIRTRQLVLALRSDSTGTSVAVRMEQELDKKRPMSVDETLHLGGDPLTLDVYGNREKRAARLILQGCSLENVPSVPGTGALFKCAVEIRS